MNKTWVEIAKHLDLSGKPRLADWYTKHMITAQATEQAGQLGSLGSLAMGTTHAWANYFYKQLNEFLLDPFLLNLQNIGQLDSFWNTAMKGATNVPAGPSVFHWAMSQIPQTQTSIALDPKAAQGDQIGIGKVTSNNYNCFMVGYKMLPKYAKFIAKYNDYLYSYYFSKIPGSGNNIDTSTLASTLKGTEARIAVASKLFNCICSDFYGCGAFGEAKDATKLTCKLGDVDGNAGDPWQRQKEALDAQKFLDLIKSKSTCKSVLDGVADVYKNNLLTFFGKMDYFYQQTVIGAYDYDRNGRYRPGQIQWRYSAMQAFRNLIYICCAIAKQLETMRAQVTEVVKNLENKDLNKKYGETCSPQQAAHLYAVFLINGFSLSTPNGSNNPFANSGLPNYIVSNYESISNCAQNVGRCNPNNAPWDTFDFSDIPASPTRPNVVHTI